MKKIYIYINHFLYLLVKDKTILVQGSPYQHFLDCYRKIKFDSPVIAFISNRVPILYLDQKIYFS